MSGDADPNWIRLSVRLYRACLWLYPRPLRQEHGEEMVLAFEARCRESLIPGGPRGLQIVLGELLPDLAASAGTEQWRQFYVRMRPRQMLALGLLCFSALGLLFQDSFGPPVTRWLASVRDNVSELHALYGLHQQEKQVIRLADSLEAQGDVQSTAMAAFLYRSLYTHRTRIFIRDADGRNSRYLGKLQAHGERAASLAGSVLGKNADLYTLNIAVQACSMDVGCFRGDAIRKLIARDPDNGYAWAAAFKWASLHDDGPGMDSAVAHVASASHYESFRGRLFADLIAAGRRLAPTDEAFQTAIAQQINDARGLEEDDFDDDLRRNCTLRPEGSVIRNERWIDRNPAGTRACQSVMALLAGSTDLVAARWALRQQFGQGVKHELWDPRLFEFGETPQPERCEQCWRPWTDAEWRQWADAWAPGDGEVPTLRRWLATQAPENRSLASNPLRQ